MKQWLIRGMQNGIRTTRYPAAIEQAEGVSPGLPPVFSEVKEDQSVRLVELCPTNAIRIEAGHLIVDRRRCVHCFRCGRDPVARLDWEKGYEWAQLAEGAESPAWPAGFQKSLHIRVVDAGDCGACLAEVKQLNNPYYNMHRLGFFFTPTPRNADVLLVVGPVTDQIRKPLAETYEAMPTPKIVMAVGACALSGGVFGPSIFSGAGVAGSLPVDIEVPGAPPPPLAILHGLLVAAGRKPAVKRESAFVLERQAEKFA